MTPKAMAMKLYNKFYSFKLDVNPYKCSEILSHNDIIKICLIAVDEILKDNKGDYAHLNPKDEVSFEYVKNYIRENIKYWLEVKDEIEKL